jgi:cyclopropane fatty-acyl-phospholipid synthase-like methyltransferase
MLSYVFMKILESRPRSYDRAMDKASRGRVKQMKENVAAEVPDGSRVLEIGCGTGELAAMCIARDSTVEGFDASPAMVEVARQRIAEEGLHDKMTVEQMGVDGMDSLPDARYDAVVSTLVFSELSDDERRYALTNTRRVLKPGGICVIADEVRPRTSGQRLLYSMVRGPAFALSYLVSKAITRPVEDLAGEMKTAGFSVIKEVRSHGDAFAMVVGTLERVST